MMQELDLSWPQTAPEEEVVLKALATQLLASLRQLAIETTSDEGQTTPWAILVAGMPGQQSHATEELPREKVTT